MSLIDTFERLESLNRHLRAGSTGPRIELAAKMEISVSTLHEYLNFMKHILRAPIKYDYRRKTYFYVNDGSFDFGFQSRSAQLIDLELYHYLRKLLLDKQLVPKEKPGLEPKQE